MQGLHILANFNQCSFDFSKESILLPYCKDILIKAGFSVVGESQHLFQPQGLTFVILLAESHLSVHTWPEEQNVAFDLYTCNYLNDNTEKTRIVYQQIHSLLNPKFTDVQFVDRLSIKKM